jgi:hypothetical protein
MGKRGKGASHVKPPTKHGEEIPFYQITEQKERTTVKFDT